MRHRKSGRKLNRNGEHRLALYRNLTKALIQHERIITTVAKAKAVRPFVEKLITLAKRGDLHARRLVLSRLGPASNAQVKPEGETPDTRTVLAKLFADIGPRFADRPGGYTRIIKRHERRLGDGGTTAYLELLKEGEKKREKAKAAPAPRVEDEAETPTPESQTPEQPPASETTAESKPEGEAGQQPPK